MEKFMRRDYSVHKDVFDISYLQFGKRYVSTNTGPKQAKKFKPENFTKNTDNSKPALGSFSEIDFIVTHDFEAIINLKFLPKFIKINDPKPWEPKFMKLRSPLVARMHKFNQTKHPHEFYHSELQLYKPFTNEKELAPDSLDRCKALFDEKSNHNDSRKVTNTKRILMKHLEEVEEGTERAKEILDSNAGTILDPQKEQDDAECADEEVLEHPDFVAKDPRDLDVEQTTSCTGKAYKKIELYDERRIEEITRKLDREQRMVLDKGVDYAKNIVKARNGPTPSVKAPLLIVQGGAGSGKSTVIDAMGQQMEKVLRTPGDNPNHPYILKVAFTGTAAANIRGQTMHSAFSFNFGNDFFSLGDKKRDEKRTLLENLKVVMIDEFSMIKADMLYQLDLRLKEIKQSPDLTFGGVAVFLFGDLLQLRPVQARYIFDEPRCEKYHLMYLADPLWEKFDIIFLIKNHRQGEDKEYADILNRFRVGNVQEDDIKKLEERVRPLNHPDIPKDALVVTCKNEDVNKINMERLDDIDEHEYVIEAIAKTQTQKSIKPYTDAAGAIRNTPLQKNYQGEGGC